MAGFTTVHGTELARVLCACGWQPESTDLLPNHVVLWKDGNFKPVSLTLYLPIGKGRVERICKKAGITAADFERLFVEAPHPQWLAVVH